MLALTFNAPFNSLTVANGYCGTWLGFVSACKLLYQNVDQVKDRTDKVQAQFEEKKLPIVLSLASSIVFLDTVIGYDCTYSSYCAHPCLVGYRD